jgi:hypothetical protein
VAALWLAAAAPEAPARALAAQETIASDRPGIGSGSHVLERGSVQVETGIQFARAGSMDTYSFGQALARIGLASFELEIFGNSVVLSRTDAFDESITTTGLETLAVGGKVPIARGVGDRMDASLQGIVTTPLGSDAFGGDWLLTTNGLVDVRLTERAAVSVNGGVIVGGEVATTLIMTPAVSLGGGLGAYGGYAGTFTFGEGTDIHLLEGGLTYLVGSDVQLDANGGYDVDTEAWFVGVGFATRWGAS